MIFANADDKNTMDVMYTLDRRVRTFGIDNDGDYQAINVQEYKPGFFEFDLKEWSKVTGHIRLAVPGRHNIYNALAMCAVCRFCGPDRGAVRCRCRKLQGRRTPISRSTVSATALWWWMTTLITPPSCVRP